MDRKICRCSKIVVSFLDVPCSGLVPNMLSRSAKAAYRFAEKLTASTLCTSPTELLWVELNEAKSALHDLGKSSKFAKLALAIPDELPVERKESMSKYVTEGENVKQQCSL